MSNKKKNLTPEQNRRVFLLAKQMSAKEVANETGFARNTVYKVCHRYGKGAKVLRQMREGSELIEDHRKEKAAHVKDEYSNTGFITVTQKYAS